MKSIDGLARIALPDCELEIAQIAPRVRSLPTLVFLHEGLGSIGLWRDFPAALANRTGCGALIYSRLGNGFSSVLSRPRDPKYMHDEALRVLPHLLEELEIEEPILIGHSDGGSIALIYAGEFPHAVRALVLEAPHIFVEDLSVKSIAAIKQQYETTKIRGRMAPYHQDVDRTFYGWNDIWLSPQFFAWNIESYVGRIRAPVLAIQGLDDEYGTSAQVESIARLAPVPVDRLLLARCGHAPHRDRRPVVEGTIVGWVESGITKSFAS